MNHEFKTSSILEEDAPLDAESTEFMTPRKHRSKQILRLGIAFVVLGVVALLGLNNVKAYPFNRPMTPLQYISMAQDKFMKAFPARALADAANFEATFETVFKEVDSADPSAMSMNVSIQADNRESKWPAVVFTFIAMPGKQQNFKEHLEAIMDGFDDLECRGKRAKECKKISDLVNITKGQHSPHFGKGEFVFVEILMPQGPQGQNVENELVATFKDHDPKFLAEVSVGRSIEDMYQHIHTNIAMLPNGVKVKASAAFASTMFAAFADLADMNPMPWLSANEAAGYMKFAMGFAKLSSRNEILYRPAKDLGDTFKAFPTLAKGVARFQQNFASGPPKITEPIKDLHKFSKGVAGIEIEGLPGGWELLVQFENFRPSKVFFSILKEGAQ